MFSVSITMKFNEQRSTMKPVFTSYMQLPWHTGRLNSIISYK